VHGPLQNFIKLYFACLRLKGAPGPAEAYRQMYFTISLCSKISFKALNTLSTVRRRDSTAIVIANLHLLFVA